MWCQIRVSGMCVFFVCTDEWLYDEWVRKWGATWRERG